MRFDHEAAQQLVALLPTAIQLNPWKDEGGAWLQDSLRFISREAAELRPGGETVITRLADIIVIQMIRAWIDSAPADQPGWLAALHDPQIGRALAAIHRTPQRAWSVAELARTFLRKTSDPLARIAERIGYESEAGFCRAFKRMFGVPPGKVRHGRESGP